MWIGAEALNQTSSRSEHYGVSAEVKALRAETPNVMKEFSAMARVGSGPKALDTKTKD
jgi:hypothetical protein